MFEVLLFIGIALLTLSIALADDTAHANKRHLRNSNHPNRHHQHQHKRITDRLSQKPIDENHYGVELPSFSYDSSEYFVGATLERTNDGQQLHLVMFLLGHNVINDKGPSSSIQSIATEEEVLYQWANALKHFKPSRNVTGDTRSSGLMCIIKNNDNKQQQQHQAPYHVPAHFIPSGVSNGRIEVLRCPIKGHTDRLNVDDISTGTSSIYVDIVRKHHNNEHMNDTHTITYDQSSAIISFCVPWNARYTGYGMKMNNFTTQYNQWHKRDVLSTNVPTVHMCVSTIKSTYDVSTVFAFIEHHINILAVDHIYLAVMFDWKSVHMSQYIDILYDKYISTGLLSIISVGMNGYDDVAGFNGIQISDKFAESFFNNQCLYLSKGVADFVVLANPNSFIFPLQSATTAVTAISSINTITRSSNFNQQSNIHNILSPHYQSYYKHTDNQFLSVKDRIKAKATKYEASAYCYSTIESIEMQRISSTKAKSVDKVIELSDAYGDKFPVQFYQSSAIDLSLIHI